MLLLERTNQEALLWEFKGLCGISLTQRLVLQLKVGPVSASRGIKSVSFQETFTFSHVFNSVAVFASFPGDAS